MSKSHTETPNRNWATAANRARCAAYYQKTKAERLPYKRLQVSEYRENNLDKVRATRAASVAAKEQYVADLKKQPCMDCGICYPGCVMDFDHVGSKRAGVPMIVRGGYSLEALKQEIAKCELVCANCHRIRTHITRKTTHPRRDLMLMLSSHVEIPH